MSTLRKKHGSYPNNIRSSDIRLVQSTKFTVQKGTSETQAVLKSTTPLRLSISANAQNKDASTAVYTATQKPEELQNRSKHLQRPTLPSMPSPSSLLAFHHAAAGADRRHGRPYHDHSTSGSPRSPPSPSLPPRTLSLIHISEPTRPY